jgi:hypothetical protein
MRRVEKARGEIIRVDGWLCLGSSSQELMSVSTLGRVVWAGISDHRECRTAGRSRMDEKGRATGLHKVPGRVQRVSNLRATLLVESAATMRRVDYFLQIEGNPRQP